MTIEATPIGSACNLQCEYCYADAVRSVDPHVATYDLEAIKRGLDRESKTCAFALFGGEPLLMPIVDLEDLFRWGKETRGRNSLSTNGTLITPAHVELFRRYSVGVGISVDGPGELNDARRAGTLEHTRAMTTRSLAALDALLVADLGPSLHVTLTNQNASPDRLPRLLDWFRELDRKGLKWARLHLLEVDSPAARAIELPEDDVLSALYACMGLQDELKGLRFELFSDAVLALLGGAPSCIWNGCDPLTTPAVQGVDALGGRTNCGRMAKDGVEWVKGDAAGQERLRMLFETPQADGGCQGCRFWFACKGSCPGSAIGGDWRNRSAHCRIWHRLLERLESDLVNVGKAPLSWPSREQERLAFERRLLSGHVAGHVPHGDHWDAPEGYNHSDGALVLHGDAGTTTMHGDSPHGDSDARPQANGFSTVQSMDAAHEMILCALAGSPPLGPVLDLGCGDGTLMRRIEKQFAVIARGVEVDARKADKGIGAIFVGDLKNVATLVPGASDTIVVSCRRFEEIPALEAWVRDHCRQAVVYSYDDPQFARVEAGRC